MLTAALMLGQPDAGESTSAERPTVSVLVKTTTLVGSPTPAEPTREVPSDEPRTAKRRDDVPAAARKSVPPPDEGSTDTPPLDPPVDGAPAAGQTETTLVPVDSAVEAATASVLLQGALTDPRRGALLGRRVTLLESLAGTVDRQHQLRVISAYWKLSILVARYHFALGQHEQLAGIHSPRHAWQETVLTAAQAEARARLRDAELAVVAAQYDLAEVSPALHVRDDLPPLPAEPPFVGVYRTNYQSLFAGRVAPPGLKRIDRTLPLRLAQIDARAVAVAAAAESVAALEGAYRENEVELAELLAAHARLRDQREAFLTSVRDYNSEIGVYALTVAGTNVDHQTLVSMLIETTPQTRSVLLPKHQVVGTSANVPIEAPLPKSRPQSATGKAESTDAQSPFRDVTPADPTPPIKLDAHLPPATVPSRSPEE